MPSRYAIYELALMFGINFLNYMDRWVGSAVAPLIQAEFDLSDFSVGLLGSAFTLVYAIGALPFGLWADRGVRRTVIGSGVAIWSLATLLTGPIRLAPRLLRDGRTGTRVRAARVPYAGAGAR